VDLLPVLILCGVIALQVVYIVRLRRALFVAEERARISSSSFAIPFGERCRCARA
jgi:hypothetical protein